MSTAMEKLEQDHYGVAKAAVELAKAVEKLLTDPDKNSIDKHYYALLDSLLAFKSAASRTV